MTEQVPTTCVRCAVGCGHVQQAVDRGYGLDLVRGDPAHPVNRGLACQRGVEETADPDGEWLTQPRVRRGGELVGTTWDVALSVAGEAIATAADRGWLHAATRYGTVALALAYLASFGIELSLNGWLPTYFRDGFGQSATRAATFAAAFSLAAGLLRPFGGYVSDLLARRGRDVLPMFAGRHREQWTFACLCAVSCSLVALAATGRTGALWPTVGAVLLVGAACAFAEGAVFAQVPATFPERSGTAAGVGGGVGTCGGIAFPLVLSGAAGRFGFHDGYLAVAALTLPALAVAAWVFRPAVAARANVAGLTGDPSSGFPEASDD